MIFRERREGVGRCNSVSLWYDTSGRAHTGAIHLSIVFVFLSLLCGKPQLEMSHCETLLSMLHRLQIIVHVRIRKAET